MSYYDIVFSAPNQSTMATWLDARGLRVVTEGVAKLRHGLELSLWNGSGKLTVAAGTYDAEGVELTPPTYAPGYFVLARIHADFFQEDFIEGSLPDDEPWVRSKIAEVLKTNGTPGSLLGGTLNYYEWENVRVYKYLDVQSEILGRGLAGHGYL